MACCGGRSGARGGDKRDPRPKSVLFEYREQGPLTLFGRVTGIRYHFPGRGARVLVDARDAPVLEVVRGLEVVRASA